MEQPRSLRLEGLAYGADYNPDQWDEDTWIRDARLMREAGVNLVSLPVFSWPKLEVEPGRFDFGWLDRVLEILRAAGIRIDLATATATPPAWLVRAHPEMLPQNADGVRLEFGSRQAYCPSSPVWRDNVRRMATVMAERYGSHPAVVLWHISNEYGDHVARCWCPESAAHFRRWLRARYGTLTRLNDAWGATVWGQTYSAWEQIEPPRTATGPVSPTQRLDFERFSSDALLELFRIEIDVLREITPELPVTTNFMSLFRELDYWDFAEVEDLVTDDAYPDPSDPASHVGAALNYGLMRSLKGGQPWLLLEQAASAVSWRDVNVPKEPGRMRIDSLQAIAHGSDGAMFFQWRQARTGPEKFHSAMLGHREEESRSFAETKALGAELQRLAPVRGTRVRSSVALVADWDSWWASSAPDSLPSQRLQWIEQARAWHRALFELGHPVDVVRASGPFDGYAIVVVPGLYLTTDEDAAALAGVVARGGRIAVGPFSGVVDRDDRVHPRGAPGPLRGLLGIEVDEQWPLADGASGAIELEARSFATRTWSEWIEPLEGTEVLARYSGGPLDGRPAATRRTHGTGSARYLSTVPDPDGLRAFLGAALEESGLPARRAPHRPVEVVCRSDADTDYIFVLNHGAQPVPLDTPAGALDLLTGAPVGAETVLAPRDALVLRRPRGDAQPFLTLSEPTS